MNIQMNCFQSMREIQGMGIFCIWFPIHFGIFILIQYFIFCSKPWTAHRVLVLACKTEHRLFLDLIENKKIISEQIIQKKKHKNKKQFYLNYLFLVLL